MKIQLVLKPLGYIYATLLFSLFEHYCIYAVFHAGCNFQTKPRFLISLKISKHMLIAVCTTHYFGMIIHYSFDVITLIPQGQDFHKPPIHKLYPAVNTNSN